MFETGETQLREWAAANGYTLISVEPGTYTQSRVLLNRSSEQEYFIKVRDASGAMKTGRARVVRTGILSVDLSVDWDR